MDKTQVVNKLVKCTTDFFFGICLLHHIRITFSFHFISWSTDLLVEPRWLARQKPIHNWKTAHVPLYIKIEALNHHQISFIYSRQDI